MWLIGIVLLAACAELSTPCVSDEQCVDAFGDGWSCRASGACDWQTEPTPPPSPVLIINEVLYDPLNQDDETGHPLGDANGDGTYVHDDDEFVELVNISGKTVDVSGYALYDQTSWELDDPRHVVPQGTVLPPGDALVVFGGGEPMGSFGDTTVQVATSGRINLNNKGDMLRVTHPSGVVVETFDVTPRSNNPDESFTRDPDITGGFVQHGSISAWLFSPGTRTDGSPF